MLPQTDKKSSISRSSLTDIYYSKIIIIEDVNSFLFSEINFAVC